ncbi:MAG: hypothetical protein K0U45_04795 [Alphaproteobacteria bacterium]|nr:hypothetical protein [Alphaproteobacteria bacterium]
MRSEYYHYALHYDDGDYFPEQRQQEVINKYVEKLNNIKKEYFYGCYAGDEKINVMAYMANLPMAKLFLNHGADLFENYGGIPPLLGVTAQKERDKNPNKFSSHNQLMRQIDRSLYSDNELPDLPSNYAITLSKLYLALGANIDATGYFDDPTIDMPDDTIGNIKFGSYIKTSYNALQISLFEYIVAHDKYIIKPDEQHRADDILLKLKDEEYPDWHRIYYRSPVTYWLESFIAAGYPASMLDTHQILYPHFMKNATPQTIKDMLANPKQHSLKANINCPFEQKCPLTPSINMRDAMGRTPLHIAGLAKNKAIYDFLISQGADITIKDFRDNLPILK